MVCRGILGWLHKIKGLPLSELNMKSAVPSKKREGVMVAFEYMQWLTGERNISSSTEGVVIRSLMQVSKPAGTSHNNANDITLQRKQMQLQQVHHRGKKSI